MTPCTHWLIDLSTRWQGTHTMIIFIHLHHKPLYTVAAQHSNVAQQHGQRRVTHSVQHQFKQSEYVTDYPCYASCAGQARHCTIWQKKMNMHSNSMQHVIARATQHNTTWGRCSTAQSHEIQHGMVKNITSQHSPA